MPGPVTEAGGAAGLAAVAEGAGFRRGRRWIVRGLDWRHAPGRIAWVVGENGAGKSTLLAALAGRARQAEGSVRIEPAGRRPRVAWLHPGMRLPPGIDVGDWIAFAEATADEPDVARLRAPGAVPGKRIRALSTGEEKRLVLEALLGRTADVVLLDEPYAHLSDRAAARLTELLVERARRSVVVVSTNQPPPGGPAEGPTLILDRPA